MRLVADDGLWSTGPFVAATPLVAVLEVSGAVFCWTIDDPPTDPPAQITFTDLTRADWLWRVVGEAGHVALVSAPEAADVDIVTGSLDPLRRLAVGHWLRRWWPASERDGIAGLDQALLDAEVALATGDVQDFFTDDTLDSDAAGLLVPHAAALARYGLADDARIRGLVEAAVALADELGVDGPGWASWAVAAAGSGTRDDYALAAGVAGPPRGAIAAGRASITWSAVPPHIFDAAEDTVDWSVQVTGSEPETVTAVVRAAVLGPDPATGIALRLRSGAAGGDGVLESDGRARLPLVDAHRRPMTESAAWNHDWTTASVTVGAETLEPIESADVRERVRRWARARLDAPPEDAFLAEILAGESAY